MTDIFRFFGILRDSLRILRDSSDRTVFLNFFEDFLGFLENFWDFVILKHQFRFVGILVGFLGIPKILQHFMWIFKDSERIFKFSFYGII